LDAGFNVDFIDADAIDNIGIPYRVLILPNMDRLPVATYERVIAFRTQRRRSDLDSAHTGDGARLASRGRRLGATQGTFADTVFTATLRQAHFVEDVNRFRRIAETVCEAGYDALSADLGDWFYYIAGFPMESCIFVANTFE